ncbi:MAG: hypothetical protein LBQ33_04335 [Oscillospiraceae bacterium]|jgi:hypothetical protein|nr:hypothetical protein [Oscillospiraceae bacterium]
MKKKCLLALTLALPLLLFACGKKEAPVQLTDPVQAQSSGTAVSSDFTQSSVYDFTQSSGTSGSAVPTEGGAQPPAGTTAGKTTTNGAGAKTTTAARPSATTGKTTTKTTTTKKATTKYFANPIAINSQEEALRAFNAAIQRVLDQKPGFSKSHAIGWDSWQFDQDMLVIPSIPLVGEVTQVMSAALSAALSEGTQTAAVQKGDSHQLLQKSGFTMDHMKSVNYSHDGSDWTVTLNVMDGSTRQQKRYLSSGISGNSPIDKGPLALATGAKIYDHMTADRVFALVKESLSILSADPLDVTESSSAIRFVAKIDGGGSLQSLTVTYNEAINIAEIAILKGGAGNTFQDIKGSGKVKIVFRDFVY